MAQRNVGPAESPEITGLLYKKRGGFGKMMPNSWQYRLFILSKDGVLTYYDTEVPENRDIFESKERGRIDLRAVKFDLATDCNEGAPTQHTLIIQPEDSEKWKLCADTKEDHSRWWKAIEKFIFERDERKRTAAIAQLNVQSDDDTDSSPGGLRGNRVGRGIELDLNNNSPTAASLSVPTFSSDTALSPRPNARPQLNSPPPSAPARLGNVGTGTGKKTKGLKLQKESGMVGQDTMEWVFVMLIVNICLYGMLRAAASWIDRFMYAAALNLVVGHSLYLRAYRLTSQSTASGAHAETGPVYSTYGDVPTAAPASTQRPSINAGVNPRPIIHSVANTSQTLIAAPVTSAAITVDPEDSVAAGRALLRQGKKPAAGFTLQQVYTEPKVSPEHTWCKADHRQFNVRVGPDYNRHKKKAPSAAPLYEPFAVDVFCTKLRADHCSNRFQFVDPLTGAPINIDTHHPYVPPVFVIQIQIPSDPPSGFFSSAEDGPGWAILMYYKITEDTVNQLKDLANASPAVKLFAEWCEKCTEDPLWRGRFKVINSCTNLDELGIPSAISAYNAKPIMIRRTGSISRGDNDGVRYMEMDIHVHKFATLAKQSIHYISSRCGQMYMQIGFVIEGVTDAELPETMFACVAVNKPQEERAEFIFETDEDA